MHTSFAIAKLNSSTTPKAHLLIFEGNEVWGWERLKTNGHIPIQHESMPGQKEEDDFGATWASKHSSHAKLSSWLVQAPHSKLGTPSTQSSPLYRPWLLQDPCQFQRHWGWEDEKMTRMWCTKRMYQLEMLQCRTQFPWLLQGLSACFNAKQKEEEGNGAQAWQEHAPNEERRKMAISHVTMPDLISTAAPKAYSVCIDVPGRRGGSWKWRNRKSLCRVRWPHSIMYLSLLSPSAVSPTFPHLLDCPLFISETAASSGITRAKGNTTLSQCGRMKREWAWGWLGCKEKGGCTHPIPNSAYACSRLHRVWLNTCFDLMHGNARLEHLVMWLSGHVDLTWCSCTLPLALIEHMAKCRV